MDYKLILQAIDNIDLWKSSTNKDIPLYLQNNNDLDIKRIV